MLHKHYYILLGIIFLWSATAYTQEKISLDAYLEKVVVQYPQIKASEKEWEAVQLEEKIAKMRENPEFEIQYAHNRESSIFHGPGVESEIAIPIDVWRKRKTNMQIAFTEVMQAELDYKAQRAEILHLAKQIYTQNWIFQELEKVMDEHFLSLAELYRKDSIQWSIGTISEMEMKQTKIEKEKAYFEWLEFQNEKIENSLLFALLIGETHETFKAVKRDSPKNIPLISWEDVADNLWDIKSKDWEISEKEYSLDLLKKERKISPEIIAGVEHHFLKDPGDLSKHTETKWTFGVGIPLPFSNRNKAPLQQQKLKIEQSRWEKEQKIIELQQEWTLLQMRLEQGKKKIESFERNILTEGDAWLKQMEKAYERGNISWIEFMYAQNNWRDLHIEYYENLLEYWGNLHELEWWLEQGD